MKAMWVNCCQLKWFSSIKVRRNGKIATIDGLNFSFRDKSPASAKALAGRQEPRCKTEDLRPDTLDTKHKFIIPP